MQLLRTCNLYKHNRNFYIILLILKLERFSVGLDIGKQTKPNKKTDII